VGAKIGLAIADAARLTPYHAVYMKGTPFTWMALYIER